MLTSFDRRLLNMGSVLYNVVMMIFRGTVAANLKNQNFLPNDLKLRHRKNPNLATGIVIFL